MVDTKVLTGALRKMQGELVDGVVQYQLPVGDALLPLNALMGEKLSIHYAGAIHCVHCGRKTKKSFNQGFCYPCFRKLAACDSCIMSPEKCHYHAGTCREPEWGERNCMTGHVVYLANSSGVKVGITRLNQVPVRWIDQGAVEALPIFRVATRRLSGLVEDLFRSAVKDRTNWRAMLKGQIPELDLVAERDTLFERFGDDIAALQQEYGVQAVQPVLDAECYRFSYPVQQYPDKVTSFNLDKTPLVEGVLQGIKGQYLLLDTGVINIRKFTAYQVDVSVAS
ncbi:DUF2797 domain-containing protein [Kistimonas asteriae]|uniref:DUF2797 domain-containing protein n=1 Tax=Kistimonas asteriae TaxID=517724 RepID=UPI001BA7AACB|nr:DUF2797 domain-containing protein [Kistimonas asteriae]